MKVTSFKDLIVWQKGMQLLDGVYTFTNDFPNDQQYRLVDQIQRSALSIPSNIAEGSRRGSKIEYRRFLYIAYASGAELETQLEFSKMRNYGQADSLNQILSLLDEVMRMLNKMIQKLST